ncbi:hypothetical protein BDFG_04767 [Blastomyces dermatitidis ATCC 26199]|nr:hypothetical protein BDFG_04767 [Blastomyces dermatitidis ATCC 26199]
MAIFIAHSLGVSQTYKLTDRMVTLDVSSQTTNSYVQVGFRRQRRYSPILPDLPFAIEHDVEQKTTVLVLTVESRQKTQFESLIQYAAIQLQNMALKCRISIRLLHITTCCTKMPDGLSTFDAGIMNEWREEEEGVWILYIVFPSLTMTVACKGSSQTEIN